MTFTFVLDWPTAFTALAIFSMILGACVELIRTRTPRAWWYDLDKRLARLEDRVERIEEFEDE